MFNKHDPTGLFTFLAYLEEARKRDKRDPWGVARGVWTKRHGPCPFFHPLDPRVRPLAEPAPFW
jgi:hypothetical protein